LSTNDESSRDCACAATDAQREIAFRRSLRAARRRRETAARSRRWTLRRRTSVVLTALATTGLAGGAFAHQTGGSASTSGPLRMGSQGAAVRALQLKLGVGADGIFGPITRAAVKRYEARNGLVADGVADSRTLRSLGLSMRPISDVTRAASVGVSTGTSALLQRIAMCESGGNPAAVDSTGRYRGKYQFSMQTWRSMGGSGDPAAAPEAVQDRLAAKLLAASGTSPWPVCGRQ
jgi:hypothetical protein